MDIKPRSWIACLLLCAILLTPVHGLEKFTHWYPYYRWAITMPPKSQKCLHENTPLSKFHKNNRVDHCKTLVNCLYANLGEMDKADFASAGILLGLLPISVSILGMTIEEGSRISRHGKTSNRWISVGVLTLCALAAPSVQLIERPLVLAGPNSEDGSSEKTDRSHEWTDEQHTTPSFIIKYAKLLIVPEILIAAGAAANVLEAAFTLGDRTTISWKCLWSFIPLLWLSLTLLPRALGWLAVIAAHYSTDMRYSSFVRGTAKMAAYVHQIFGVLVFSSCMFIGTLDGLGVFARFVGSAFFSRLVYLAELHRILLEDQSRRLAREPSDEIQLIGRNKGRRVNTV